MLGLCHVGLKKSAAVAARRLDHVLRSNCTDKFNARQVSPLFLVDGRECNAGHLHPRTWRIRSLIESICYETHSSNQPDVPMCFSRRTTFGLLHRHRMDDKGSSKLSRYLMPSANAYLSGEFVQVLFEFPAHEDHTSSLQITSMI